MWLPVSCSGPEISHETEVPDHEHCLFNDMRTSKRNANEQYRSTPTIHSAQLPLTWGQIYQRARDIYFSRGGTEGMTLNDWLQAEQELQAGNNPFFTD